jgi:CheY-like chemotaxis protein
MTMIATGLVQQVKRWTEDGPTSAADRSMSILVVDDEEGIRRYVDRVLSEAGHRTTLSASGAEAIAAVTQGARFDLLLTDVMMPGMTGAELALRLREVDPDLKVLYLTGYADRLFATNPPPLQEEAFLQKPCSALALRQAVSLAVTGRLLPDPVDPIAIPDIAAPEAASGSIATTPDR